MLETQSFFARALHFPLNTALVKTTEEIIQAGTKVQQVKAERLAWCESARGFLLLTKRNKWPELNVFPFARLVIPKRR